MPESGPICDLGFMAKRPPSPPAAPVPVPLRAIFGANLKAARIKAGLKQADLATAASVTQAYISHVEGGARNLTFDVAEVLASTVGYSVRDLLKPTKQKPRS